MPEIMAMESTPFINEGMYVGTVTAIEEQASTTPGWADQFKFTFVLDGQFHDKGDRAGEPIDMWHWCSQKMTPNSKLWKLAQDLGVQPVLGVTFNTDVLIGRRANLVVKHVEGTKGPQAKIVDMLKVGGAAPAAAAAVAEEAEWCHACTLKGKRTPMAKYAGTGEPLCEVHEDDDLPAHG